MTTQKPQESPALDKDKLFSAIKDVGSELTDAGREALRAYNFPASAGVEVVSVTKDKTQELASEVRTQMKNIDIKEFLSKFPIPDQEALIKRLEQNGITIPSSIKADIAKIVASGKQQIEGVAGEVQDVVQTARGVVDSSALKNLTPEQIAQKAQKVQDALDGKGGTLSAAKDVVDLAGGGMKGLAMGGVFLISAILRYFGLDFGKGILSDLGLSDILKKKGDATGAKPSVDSSKGSEKPRQTVSEKVEDQIGKMKSRYWEMLEKSGFIKDPVEQKKAFDRVWERYSKEGKFKNITADTLKSITENKEWNIGEVLFKGTGESLNFMVDLVKEKAIPMDAIYVKIGEYGTNMIKMGLKSAWSLVTNSPTEAIKLIGDFSQSDIQGLSPERKEVILAMMHANMALPLYLTGIFAGAVAKLTLLPLYWDQGVGKTQAFAMGNAAVGNFEKAGKNLEDLLTMLGSKDNRVLTETKKAYEDMHAVIREVQLKSQVTETYMRLQKSGMTSTRIAEELSKIGKNMDIPVGIRGTFDTMIQTLGKATSDADNVIQSYLKNSGNLARMPALNRLYLGIKSQFSIGPMGHHIDEARLQAENIGHRLAEVVKNKDLSLFKVFQQLKLPMAFEKFIEAVDKGVLPILAKDATDATKIMERFIRAIPPGFEHFFSSLAVSLTVANVASAKSGEKLETLANDIMMMNPLIGGYILIKEGLTVEGVNPTKVGYLVAGSTVWALAGYQMASISGSLASGVFPKAKLAEFTLGPIYTAARGVTAMARGVSYGTMMGSNILKPGVAKPFLHPVKGPASLLMLAGIIGYYSYESAEEEKQAGFLREKGILNAAGGINLDQLKKTFSELPTEKRGPLIEKLLNDHLGSWGISAKMEKDGKKAIVHTDAAPDKMSPIPLDVLTNISETLKDMGVEHPEVWLSKTATENIKRYIDTLQVDAGTKSAFYSKFGIKVS